MSENNPASENKSSVPSTMESKQPKVQRDQEILTARVLRQLKQNKQQLGKVTLLVNPLQKYFLSSQKQLQAVKLIQRDVKQLQNQISQLQREIRGLAGKVHLRYIATKHKKTRGKNEITI
jgi:hypothetical protein